MLIGLNKFFQAKMNFKYVVAVFILTTLNSVLASDIPVLKYARLEVTPNEYNSTKKFTLQCTVELIPDTVHYSVSFKQNKKSIAWYDMIGKKIIFLF